MNLDRERIAARFSAAALNYDSHAQIQRRVARRLAELLETHSRLPAPGIIVEFGCGTGFLTEEIRRRFPVSRVHASDIAPEMIEQARKRLGCDQSIEWRVADAEDLDFPSEAGRIWIISNLCVQWFSDFPGTIGRHLRAAPLVAFSTLVDGTFAEWIAGNERLGRRAGVRNLIDGDSLANLMRTAGAKQVDVIREHVSVTYPNALAFLRTLRGIGATTPHTDHRPAALHSVLRAYDDTFIASYEIAHVIAQNR
ncbi:MAG TPA: methyltransferase domain-containing protein [Candidatus Baltobacteraceae bacterium]|jgi:malonyl-CoA O-methyltransferase|nr:methyltransferase domain-containing protein [Candidatus Baltobacteraceae bacterium]